MNLDWSDTTLEAVVVTRGEGIGVEHRDGDDEMTGGIRLDRGDDGGLVRFCSTGSAKLTRRDLFEGDGESCLFKIPVLGDTAGENTPGMSHTTGENRCLGDP